MKIYTPSNRNKDINLVFFGNAKFMHYLSCRTEATQTIHIQTTRKSGNTNNYILQLSDIFYIQYSVKTTYTTFTFVEWRNYDSFSIVQKQCLLMNYYLLRLTKVDTKQLVLFLQVQEKSYQNAQLLLCQAHSKVQIFLLDLFHKHCQKM